MIEYPFKNVMNMKSCAVWVIIWLFNDNGNRIKMDNIKIKIIK